MAFTRARSKLVVFGSRKTLDREPLLKQFFELMEGQGWIWDLLGGAGNAHDGLGGGSVKRNCPVEGKENRPVKKMKIRPVLRDLIGN